MRCLLITYSFAVASGVALVVMTAASSFKQTNPMTQPNVSVTLRGSTKEISGVDVRPDVHSRSVGSGRILEAHLLTLALPNGEPITLNARSMSFIAERGTVLSVYVRRPLKPAPFQDVMADLHRTIKAMGYEPNETMQQMTTWGDIPGHGDRPGISPYEHNAKRIILSEDVDLHVKVKPDPERGWFYVMIFSTILESRREVRGAATQSTTNPATQSSIANDQQEGKS